MAISREQKVETLKNLKTIVDKSKSLVFVNFKGLTVAAANEMRRGLKAAGVKYLVAKKTLTKRALSEATIEGSVPELPGELALAYGDDLVAPARELHVFVKKNPGMLSILGGVFDGRFMSQNEMLEIATIPPLPVLHGKFVNIINSPIQRFVIALDQIAQQKQ